MQNKRRWTHLNSRTLMYFNPSCVCNCTRSTICEIINFFLRNFISVTSMSLDWLHGNFLYLAILQCLESHSKVWLIFYDHAATKRLITKFREKKTKENRVQDAKHFIRADERTFSQNYRLTSEGYGARIKVGAPTGVIFQNVRARI